MCLSWSPESLQSRSAFLRANGEKKADRWPSFLTPYYLGLILYGYIKTQLECCALDNKLIAEKTWLN